MKKLFLSVLALLASAVLASASLSGEVTAGGGDIIVVETSQGDYVLEWYGGHTFDRGDSVTLVGQGGDKVLVVNDSWSGTYYIKR
jgi:uncharacterized protein YodC (DUF2158 family)